MPGEGGGYEGRNLNKNGAKIHYYDFLTLILHFKGHFSGEGP